MTTWEEFMRELEAEAKVEGPAAVAQVNALRAQYGTELRKKTVCMACGSETRVGRASHKFIESGLSNVTLTGIKVRRCTNESCGEIEVVIPKLSELLSALAAAILRKRNRFTREERRYLRACFSSDMPSAAFSKRVHIAAARIRPMMPAEVEHWSAGDNSEAIVSGGSDEAPVRAHLHITPDSAALVLSRCGLTEDAPRPTPPELKKLAKLVKKYRRMNRPSRRS